MSELALSFRRERETKNTVRFSEDGDEAEQAIGTLYLKKEALEQLGNPEELTVTVRALMGARERSPATRKGYHAGRQPANAGKTYPAEVLTGDEVRGLLRACSNRAPTGVRNRALIVLLYRGGLRVSEALALAPKDADADAGTITVLHGKGDKRRVVGLDPAAFAVLERWLEARRSLGLGRRARLFCTLQGAPLDDSYVRRLLPRLARKAGIEKRVHAHGLRHTHAFELAAEGMPPHLIQAQLGHGSLATTDRYLRHVAPRELLNATRRRTAPTRSLLAPGATFRTGLRSTRWPRASHVRRTPPPPPRGS